LRVDQIHLGKTFKALYSFFRTEVVLASPPREQVSQGQTLRLVVSLVFKAFFYYDQPEEVPVFLAEAAMALSQEGAGTGLLLLQRLRSRSRSASRVDEMLYGTDTGGETDTAESASPPWPPARADRPGRGRVRAVTSEAGEESPLLSSALPAGGGADGQGRLVLADMFVQAVARASRTLTQEEVLVHHLLSFQHLAPLAATLPDLTRNLLESTLFGFMFPGGPLYPTAAVRSAAATSMDRLFPRGKWSRRAVKAVFQVLHPYYLVAGLLARTLAAARSIIGSIKTKSAVITDSVKLIFGMNNDDDDGEHQKIK
jgi:hypothetical protein